MTTNARLIIDNLADAATLALTTGTEIATMPLANLQLYNNSRVFRTNDTNIVISVTLPSSQWLSGLALWKHNLTADATVQIVAKDLAGTTVLDTGVQPAMGVKALGDIEWGISELGETHFTQWRLAYSVFWFNLVSAKTVEISINDSARVDPLDITRLYLGRALSPTYNFAWNSDLAWTSKAKQYPTAGGSNYSVKSEAWREGSIELNNITDTDRPHFSEAFRKVTTQEDWFISLYPEVGGQLERDYSFATKLTKTVKMKRKNINYYQAKLQLREV